MSDSDLVKRLMDASVKVATLIGSKNPAVILELGECIEELITLMARVAKLEEALRWYAGDGSTYDGIDVGLRAREALATHSGGGEGKT